MSDDIIYSSATSKDKNAIIKLHSLLYEDDDTKTKIKIAAEIDLALKNKLVWVAKIHDEVIGYILCQFFDKDRRYFPNSIFIDGLFVKKEHRKKGVGKTLINMILKNKYPNLYTYFSITHDPASTHLTTFYKSFGFVVKGVTNAGNIILTKPKKENQETHVDPRHVEHAFDLPFWRDNTKLWALKVPIEEMNIEELLWILDVPFWEDIQGNIVFTPKEVMNNLDHYPEHQDKIKKADTSYPIDIMKNKKGKWLTLDGLHRLVRLVMEGKQTVRVRKVPPDLIHLTARDE